MDFGLREVLILVGFVVIAGILFDGYRRMRKSKMGEIELPTEMGGSGEDDWEHYKGELPNGGARKVPLSVRRAIADPHLDEHSHMDADLDFQEGFGSAIDEREPSLSAAEDALEHEEFVSERRSAPTYQEQDPFVDPMAGRDDDLEQADLFADDPRLQAAKAHQQAQLSKKTGSRRAETSTQQPQQEASPELELDPNLQEVLVINIMAREGEISGQDLHRVLLSCGFLFGDMNIFHRYEQHSGRGGLLFSAANVMEPGVFDVNNMDQFSTPGICLFMKFPGPKWPMTAFNIFMDTSRKIANLLDAEVKDEHHIVMRQQTAEHYRQRVLDFERKFLSYKASQKQV